MTTSEVNRVLRRRYNLHKQLEQTIQRYPQLQSRAKKPKPTPPFVREKFQQLLNEYNATSKELVELTRENVRRLRKAALENRSFACDPDELLAILIAFFTKIGIIDWLEEIGPWPTNEGKWLDDPDPWEEKDGQWPESKGNWYLFLGTPLTFTAHSKEELEQYLLEKALQIGSLTDEELINDKYLKKLLD